MNEFLNFCIVELGLSNNTIEAYRSDISQFLKFIKDDEINAQSGNRFIQSLNTSPNTKKRKYMTLRSFFKFLIDVKLVLHKCELVKLEPVSGERTSPKPVDLSVINNMSSNTNTLLDKVLIELIYATGLRASEICLLKKSSILWEKGFCRIICKGNQERIVPITQSCLDLLRDYLKLRRDEKDDLLVRENGEPIDRFFVYRQVLKYSGISPHQLRHSFATHLLDNDVDLMVVKNLLGHASIDTTQCYLQVTAKRKRDVYKRYFLGVNSC